MTFLSTTDRIKLTAIEALLLAAGVEVEVFDMAAGATWPAIIPLRLVIDENDAPKARRAMAEAGFRQAADGEWDL